MINKIFFLTILTFVLMPLFTQENLDSINHDTVTFDSVASDTITSIEVVGLKRTKQHIAENPLEKFIGQKISDFDQNDVFAVVKEMGVLEPVSVEFAETEEGLEMIVAVEEKWTFFPLPIIYADSGGYSFGFFVVDSNAFGVRDSFILGGIYGNYGWSGMLMYNYNPRRKGLPGFNGLAMYGQNNREDLDKDEIIHRKFSTERFQASLGINYLFFDLFTGALSVSFANITLKETNDMFNPPDNGAIILELNPRFSIQSSSWDGFFLSQKSVSLGYGFNYAIEGTTFHEVEFRGVLEQSIIPGFRLILKSGGIWKSTSDLLFEEGPQKAQVNILPRNYSARNHAGFSAGLEKHLFNLKHGTISVHGSYQGVYSYGEISDSEFNHGPSAGVVFYLSRVALPAFSLGAAYNVNSNLWQGAFSVGMSF